MSPKYKERNNYVGRLFFMFVTVIYFLFLKKLGWSKRKCITLHSSAFDIYFCETNEEIAFYFYGGDLTRINPFVNNDW